MASPSSRYINAPTYSIDDARRGPVVATGLSPIVSPPETFRLYQVQAGDRWDVIAMEHLGDPQLWWQIADINPELFDPRALRPGILIRLP